LNHQFESIIAQKVNALFYFSRLFYNSII